MRPPECAARTIVSMISAGSGDVHTENVPCTSLSVVVAELPVIVVLSMTAVPPVMRSSPPPIPVPELPARPEMAGESGASRAAWTAAGASLSDAQVTSTTHGHRARGIGGDDVGRLKLLGCLFCT